ncbi:HDIG domain-containing protein [Candidatus Sumerlaeota bacterium]|nr:HDIG domain-containing protein [Candidatus Sumerlaeota bacterium]
MTSEWSRERALALLRRYVTNDVLIKHCLASEAIMRAVAARLGEDAERWGLAGLLHDLDFEETKDLPSEHAAKAAAILAGEGLAEDIVLAIREHNSEGLGIARQSRMGIALTAAETVTGLIVASALVLPDKRLASVKASSVRKRMKEKAFARNVSRERIVECEKIGLPLDEFLALSVEAMEAIAADLNL